MKSFLTKDSFRTHLSYMANAIFADELGTQGAGASAAIVLA